MNAAISLDVLKLVELISLFILSCFYLFVYFIYNFILIVVWNQLTKATFLTIHFTPFHIKKLMKVQNNFKLCRLMFFHSAKSTSFLELLSQLKSKKISFYSVFYLEFTMLLWYNVFLKSFSRICCSTSMTLINRNRCFLLSPSHQ